VLASSSLRTSTLDTAGAVSAALCAVHCSVSGLWLAIVPGLGLGLLLDPRLEQLFLWSAVLLGGLAFTRGWRHHRSVWPALLFGVGLLALLLVRPFVPEGSGVEIGVVLLGAASLISAHWQNARLQRRAARLCAA